MTSRPRLDTIRFLTLDEIGRLLAAARGKSRDRALFLLAYRHGLRASEVGLLRAEDLDLPSLRLIVQQVLARPAWRGRLTARDLHALTPLFWTHVNPYGRFELDMRTRIAALT